MFNQLIESADNHGGTVRKSAYLGTTTVIYGAFVIALFVWSLYSVNLTLGDDSMDVASLVQPVEIPSKTPPVLQSAPSKPAPASSRSIDYLRDPVRSISDNTTPPDKISTTVSRADVIRDVPYIKSPNLLRASNSGGNIERTGSTGNQPAIAAVQPKTEADEIDVPPPAVVKPTPAPTPAALKATQTLGVINGRAINLVKPPYPPAAKAVHASGAVNVQVLISEEGSVISAAATSGHPLLRAAAVAAAKASRFSPTMLSKQPVKVTGIIVYNFVPQ